MAMQDTMSAWFCTMNSWLSTGGFLLLFLRIAMAGRELAAASPLPAQLSPRPGRGGGGGGGRAAEEWQPPSASLRPGRREQSRPPPAAPLPAGGHLPLHLPLPAPGGGEGQRPAVQTDQRRRLRRLPARGRSRRVVVRAGACRESRAEPCRLGQRWCVRWR